MKYTIDDLKTSALDKASSPERVEKVVVFILEDKNKTTPENTMSTDEIKTAYKELKNQHTEIIQIPENTIATTISILASKADSIIQCPGKRQGYFITLEQNTPEETECSPNIDNSGKEKLLEKDLYPAIQTWMNVSLDIKSIDISSKRGSDKWRNPDLLGIKEIDFLGEEKFEITTVEVKPNKQDWTMYIFEAVSHSLFSNRTYFAFLKDSFLRKIQDEMKLYASRFGIGIISVAIDDNERENITTSEQLLKALEEGNCQIKEEVPAPYHIPDIYLQKKFLDGLNIHTKTDLRNLH